VTGSSAHFMTVVTSHVGFVELSFFQGTNCVFTSDDLAADVLNVTVEIMLQLPTFPCYISYGHFVE